jgi:preprotein translocase subunit SecA
MNELAPRLIRQEEENGPGDFSLDEKTRQAFLTEEGHQRVESLLIEDGILKEGHSLYDIQNIALVHHLYSALRAHYLYSRDVDYIVKDGQIIIVDEHTGRLMPGRRWSDGMHQAVEAKEGVPIKQENQTLASITFQNYFRLYEKLAGMTGTADTEAYEFQNIYGLEVVVIPTNQAIVRQDAGDLIFLTAKVKYDSIVKDIKERSKRGQPILVGTTSIESSEYLSELLDKEKIPHQVLNAKFHEKEAKIIAQAGRAGTVTIATNMAGRGTDIVLGGSLEAEIKELDEPTPEVIAKLTQEWQQRHDAVIAAGGLHVLGTERNESRRIDNQLRGRSGRQGDPGSSQFYLSLEDNLMRIFAPERMGFLMRKMGMREEEAIENALVTRAIENAQRKVEGHNFDIRKQLLEYDDVANDQRKVIYSQRQELMAADDIGDTIAEIREDVIQSTIGEFIPPQSLEEQWDVPGLEQKLEQAFALKLPLQQWLEQDSTLHEEGLREKILAAVNEAAKEKENMIGPMVMRQLEKSVMLQSLDIHWREHLAAMDHLRRGIHLRGYAQKNPKQEYKREAFLMFTDLLGEIKYDVVSTLCSLQIQTQVDPQVIEEQRRKETAVSNVQYMHPTMAVPQQAAVGEQAESQATSREIPMETFVRDTPKVGRNEPCPCGSGKKFKNCHGQLD